jgi:hypothetical protein
MHCGTMNPTDSSVAKKYLLRLMRRSILPGGRILPNIKRHALPQDTDDELGIVTFTEQFRRYLGAISSSSLTEECAEDPTRSCRLRLPADERTSSARALAPRRSHSHPRVSSILPCPRARHLVLRLRVLGADYGVTAIAEHVPHPLRAIDGQEARSEERCVLYVQRGARAQGARGSARGLDLARSRKVGQHYP